MLGELSLDYVKEQMDIYNNYHKSNVLDREVAEEVIKIDKESHKVQYKSAEVVKTVDIP